MFLIDFNSTKKEAFTHGLLKGLAAPVLLFHTERVPTPPEFKELEPATYQEGNPLEGDWKRIGADIQTAIDKHEHKDK
jgi:hypothetical protein